MIDYVLIFPHQQICAARDAIYHMLKTTTDSHFAEFGEINFSLIIPVRPMFGIYTQELPEI